jgi:hypothetical protein
MPKKTVNFKKRKNVIKLWPDKNSDPQNLQRSL